MQLFCQCIANAWLIRLNDVLRSFWICLLRNKTAGSVTFSRKAISIKFPTVSFLAYEVLVFVLLSERHSPGSGVRLKRCAFQETEERKKEYFIEGPYIGLTF